MQMFVRLGRMFLGGANLIHKIVLLGYFGAKILRR